MSKREYVLGSIAITIIDSTAFTFPYSYSQIYPTFRTACGDLTAARTDLGRESLTHFFKQYFCALAFIPKHCFECTKPLIENRFCHFSFDQFSCTQISNYNHCMAFYKLRTLFMQMIFATVLDLGV